jgi:hypothetical protein
MNFPLRMFEPKISSGGELPAIFEPMSKIDEEALRFSRRRREVF